MKKEAKILIISALSILSFKKSYSQADVAGGAGHIGVAGFYCGWNAGTLIPFSLEHRGTDNINFLTGSIQRATILGTAAGPTQGFLGIGLAAPLFRLDVNDDVNLNMTAALNQGYRINSTLALYEPQGGALGSVYVGNTGNPGNTGLENTMVGLNSGNSAAALSNHCSFLGSESGFNDNASGGTFLGYRAGRANTTGDFNTFVGTQSGLANNIGANNAFLGFQSGLNNTTGNLNTFAGVQSGVATTGGGQNAFFGFNAGPNNTTGNSNVAIGPSSGVGEVNGAENVFVGFNTSTSAPTLINGIAIGANAQVVNNNQMILGDNSVNVGVGLSSDPLGPLDKLEINTGVANTSGLKFRQLNSGSPAGPNPGPGFLAVDPTGKVIYVNAATAGALGNICGAGTNLLTSSWEIPTNNFNFRFIDNLASAPNIYSGNNVGIGTSCAPIAKLDILAAPTIATPALPIAVNVLQQNIANNTNYSGISAGIRTQVIGNNRGNVGFSVTATGGRTNFGVLSTLFGPLTGLSNTFNVGIRSQVMNAQSNVGVQGIASTNVPSGSTFGGQFSVSGDGGTNYGVYCIASAPPTTPFASTYGYYTSVALSGPFIPTNYIYGVYSNAPAPNGLNTVTNNNYAGFFNGGVYTAQIILPSDETIKKNKNIITQATVNKLALIDAISFDFDTTVANPKGLSLPAGLQYGFKSQQVETVYPELVTMVHKPEEKDTLGNIVKPATDIKGINYIGFIALLTKANQEQQKTIESLKEQNAKQDSINKAIQDQISIITSTASTTERTTKSNKPNQFEVDLNDKEAIVLDQNVPNPFAEQTTISFNVPDKYSYAQIIFSTYEGRILKIIDINKKGKGQLTVYANDLSNGMYNYSLVVDGKTVETKKMVKQ